MTRLILILLTSLFLLSNCRKNEYVDIPMDVGHSYIPLKLGQEFIYKADSFKYGFNNVKKDGDTIPFFIKEIVVFELKDSSATTYTLARYHSPDATHWMFVTNHFYQIEKLRVNHIENGITTTHLVFPVSPNYYWNGNQLNKLPPKEFSYSFVNGNFKVGAKNFPNSLKVSMDSTVNYINHDIIGEVYSKNVGLVYKEDIHLTYRNNDSLNDQGMVVLQRPPVIDKGTVLKRELLRFK